MSKESVPQGSGTHEDDAPQPPTVADAAFCELVAGDLGVKPATARTAFIGEGTKRVLGVASWAMDKTPDPEERGKMILAWAKKRGCGAFRASPDEYISLAGSVGKGHMATCHENEAIARLLLRYWCASPKRLARLLDEVEVFLNVRDEVRLAREMREDKDNGAGA